MLNFRRKDIFLIVVFYVFFSLKYHIVLWYSASGYDEGGFWGWLDFREYWYSSGMQYVFFFLASIIIWFFGIRLLRGYQYSVQMVSVAVLIPIVVYCIRELRYSIVDYYELNRLKNTGEIWDWYIPTLFMLIQFGCYFAYRYFRENQRKLKLEGELRNAALKSELSAIKAQLNPHFLYNIFNTISASVPEGNEKTRDLIAELSDLFRYQLKASKVELVPLREELTFIRKYLKLEKERFQERLELEINVDKDNLDEMIPPMLLQPLVENSIKHGLSSLVEGGKVSINIKKKAGKLKFEISDTGVGVKDKSKIFNKGIGLTNTRMRLEKIYNSGLELNDNTPKGLKVSFTL